jgi:hypothetical protein
VTNTRRCGVVGDPFLGIGGFFYASLLHDDKSSDSLECSDVYGSIVCDSKKTSALVPRKVEETWGSVASPFITINEVAFLYHRETDNILDIIKRGDGFAYIKGGC